MWSKRNTCFLSALSIHEGTVRAQLCTRLQNKTVDKSEVFLNENKDGGAPSCHMTNHAKNSANRTLKTGGTKTPWGEALENTHKHISAVMCSGCQVLREALPGYTSASSELWPGQPDLNNDGTVTNARHMKPWKPKQHYRFWHRTDAKKLLCKKHTQ